MEQLQHPMLACLLMLIAARPLAARSSAISDLKSKISGVEELLEEFRQQLQQDQAHGAGDEADSCAVDFSASEERIIRTKVSIQQGAAFLLAPDGVYSWRDCVHACCAQPHCTVAVLQEAPRHAGGSLGCYLFNCTYRSKDICSFSPQRGFTTYSRAPNTTQGVLSGPASSSVWRSGGGPSEEEVEEEEVTTEVDEPPRSNAGQDVVIQLPTDWAVLDGRDSVDDHRISRYEWTLVKGDTAINMKSTHPGLLKVSGLREGVYTFQMTIMDSSGQKSSDNVSVTVLAPKHQAEACTGHCSNYQFKCDDGCCIDISYACDGKQHCPDRSDEDFCSDFDSGRKSVTHRVDPLTSQISAAPTEAEDASMHSANRKGITPAEDRSRAGPPQDSTFKETAVSQDPCAADPVVGPCKGTFPRWYYNQNTGECKHFLFGGCQGNHNNFLQESDCVSECIQRSPAFRPASVAPAVTKETDTHAVEIPQNKAEGDPPRAFPAVGRHPPPESGAILPLALGLLITALLLLMIGCRLRLVRHRTKKARPLTTEESDYLINGMYL
ncbi:Low-density lipoprotein receptor-related protein 11 [Oryzias melastigma]|nr:low-density lipoprotein receptor-related protein 11 [Oryzias melastigma]KAF6735850.1 Low-density lipoprotein receptor-related protein 11 [Oryzias melastigma]